MLDACLRLTMSRREVVASKAMGHRVKHIQVVMKKRPWQDSNLQSLVPKTNALSIRPQGLLPVLEEFIIYTLGKPWAQPGT